MVYTYRAGFIKWLGRPQVAGSLDLGASWSQAPKPYYDTSSGSLLFIGMLAQRAIYIELHVSSSRELITPSALAVALRPPATWQQKNAVPAAHIYTQSATNNI